MTIVAWILFVIGALLEVGGDALLRVRLGGGGTVLFLIANTVEWAFSKLFEVYVCVFALVSSSLWQICFSGKHTGTTWFGLGVILPGGLIIRYGPHR